MPAADASQWHPTYTPSTHARTFPLPFMQSASATSSHCCCKPKRSPKIPEVNFQCSSVQILYSPLAPRFLERCRIDSSELHLASSKHNANTEPTVCLKRGNGGRCYVQHNNKAKHRHLRAAQTRKFRDRNDGGRRASLIDSSQFACSLAVSFTAATSLTRDAAALLQGLAGSSSTAGPRQTLVPSFSLSLSVSLFYFSFVLHHPGENQL